MRDEFAIVAAPEPEGNLPAKIPAPGLLICLHLPDTLADSVALCLGECGQLGWSLISATDGRSRREAAVRGSRRTGATSCREQPPLPTLAGFEFIAEDVPSHALALSARPPESPTT